MAILAEYDFTSKHRMGCYCHMCDDYIFPSFLFIALLILDQQSYPVEQTMLNQSIHCLPTASSLVDIFF